jgi:uncharacterized protein (DUF58 family)
LELTTAGRVILWLGICLLAAGTLISNVLTLLSAALLFLYLLVEGVLFHRAVNLAKETIKLESRPSMIETTVGRPFKVETVITNASHSEFSIVQFSHDLPPHINEEPSTPPKLTLQSYGKQLTETLLRTKIPGRFETTASTTFLEGRSHLFSQAVAFPNKITIMARPLVNRSVGPIEASVLQDLVADHRRGGTGTDLAGIRPYNIQDDFHTIYWKATARAGKLMARESYLERDPTIILMVDVSASMNARTYGPSILEGFLNEAGNFLAAIRIASPMGLILYDRHRVVANIEARQGVDNRERIVRTLLERSKTRSVLLSPERQIIRPYADWYRATNSMMRNSAFTVRTKGYWERLSTFASFVLPFYERAESKYFEHVRGQGAFKAFEIICTFREPVLVIVISDGKSNLDGVAQGAKSTRILDHEIILVVIGSVEPTDQIELMSDLQHQGIGVLRCRPDELSRAVNAKILELSHRRAFLVRPAW